jgi:hypothetical protein
VPSTGSPSTTPSSSSLSSGWLSPRPSKLYFSRLREGANKSSQLQWRASCLPILPPAHFCPLLPRWKHLRQPQGHWREVFVNHELDESEAIMAHQGAWKLTFSCMSGDVLFVVYELSFQSFLCRYDCYAARRASVCDMPLFFFLGLLRVLGMLLFL